MAGDHTVLGVFTKLTQGTPFFFLTVALYILGTIVSFIQAFVFSLLTMIYIRLGVSHDH
jgi:F-type H+-transporting ATPase subunit a